MTAALLTPAARRHSALMARAIRPFAARLDRELRARLHRRAFDESQVRALLTITPSARSRLRSLPQFLEQVEYNGRRLAKLNVPPCEIQEVLREFDSILDSVLAGEYQPAREQLQLATILTLRTAFYRVREAETQAFFGLYRAEAEAHDVQDLFRRFVGILTQAFHARCGRLLLNQPLTGRLSRPLFIEHGKRDEALIADPAMRGRYASYWSYPLGGGAMVQFGFRVRYPWLPRELAMLDAVAERCRAAFERSRLEQEVRRLEAEAQQTEEQERRRIGRDLHDEVGQSLLLLRLQLEMMEREAPKEMRPQLETVRGVAERTVVELRRIVAALSPAVLERLGLQSALRQLAARFRKVHPGEVRLRISVPSNPLSMQTQEVIYRVAQECLQNVAKHSQASHVNLFLKMADKSIRLSVTDDGKGFSSERAGSQPMSFGLAGMRERAALLGGTLAIRSRPGKGTAVALELPLTFAQVTGYAKDSRTVD